MKKRNILLFLLFATFCIIAAYANNADKSTRENSSTVYTVNGVSFTMVKVQGGTFKMGATAEQGTSAQANEKPAHDVMLSDYSIGQTEVTQELWLAVMGTNPSTFTAANGYYDNLQRPVETVTWSMCQTFITKLNQLTGMVFRLPTEAEWEFAARGGTNSSGYMYAGSNTIDDVAWYRDNAYVMGSASFEYGPHSVGTKQANELGLYDMTGNVGEWCQDWYGNYSNAQVNPTGPTSGSNRVVRGGAWTNYATYCRVSYRGYNSPTSQHYTVGLRLAMSVNQNKAYAVFNGGYLTLYYDNLQDSRTGTIYQIADQLNQCPWANAGVTKATFHSSFANYSPTSTAHWFDGCSNLNEIAGTQYLKTNQVTDMSYMFNGCSSLANIDLSNFVTDNVTNMTHMFSGTSITKLNVDGFDTHNVTDMSYMFSDCASLQTIDISGIDTNSLTKADGMFKGDGGLNTIYCETDWSNQSMSSTDMFSNCYNLVGGNGTTYNSSIVNKTYARPDREGTKGYFTAHFTEFNVKGVSFTMVLVEGGTFSMGATTEQGSDAQSNEKPVHDVMLSNYNIGQTEVTQALWKAVMGTNPSRFTAANGFTDNLNRPVEYVSWEECQVFIKRLNKLTGKQFRLPTEAEWEFAARGGTKSKGYKYAGSNTIGNIAWYSTNASAVGTSSLDYGPHSVATKAPNELWLYDMSGNVLEWVHDWYGIYGYAQVDPTGPATGVYGVTRGGAFNSEATGCRVSYRSNLYKYQRGYIGLRLAIDADMPDAPVTQEAYAVLDNTTLTFYYDDKQDTRSGTAYSVEYTFTQCPWINDGVTKAVFDLSFADYRPQTTSYWFNGCSSLTEIVGIENLNTSEVTNMSYMFNGCSSLTELDVSDFITDNVTSMLYMFRGTGVNKLDVSCFNTSKVTNMGYMFSGCTGLTSLDVSGFDISKVTTMAYMFSQCTALTTIYCDNDWTGTSATNNNMFSGCTSLVGGNGTRYNSSYVNKAYARPDRTNYRGYFTAYSSDPVYTGSTQAYAVLSNGVLMFYYDNLMNTRSGKKFNIAANVGLTMPTWYGSRRNINRAQFDASFADYRPTSTACWFYDCPNLVSIDSIHNLNTSQATSMTGMFRFCRKLTSIDVTGFDTRNVTDMSYMFCYCEGLVSLDVSNFDTEKVVNMEHMFHTIPLASLDLSNFNTANVTRMNTMFNICQNLRTVNVSEMWATNSVTDNGGSMFAGCKSIVGSMGTEYSNSHTNIDYAHIDEGEFNPGYLSGPTGPIGDPEAYAVLADSVLTFYYDPYKERRHGTVFLIGNTVLIDYNTDFWIDNSAGGGNIVGPEWAIKTIRQSIKKVQFKQNFTDYNPSTTAYWFYKCEKLESIEGIQYLNTDNVTHMEGTFYNCISLSTLDVSGFNTSMVKNMIRMFSGCSSLTSLDVSGFNTSCVTNMYGLFSGCSSLTSLDVSGFNTSCVTNMGELFSGCSSLTSLDVSGFNTSCVTDMRKLFSGCRSLTNLDVSHFNTSKVVSIEFLFNDCQSLDHLDVSNFDTDNISIMMMVFAGCSNLQSLDLSMWNTQNVTDMYRLFMGCSRLESLDISHFNTKNVTNMSGIFIGCKSLSSIDLSSFNTENVTDMHEMFENTSFTHLDLSNFNTRNITKMNYMFYSSNLLKTIYVSDNWSTEKVSDQGNNMFKNCTSLVGGAGTVYDPAHTYFSYAHVDGGVSNPGYFTLKSTMSGDVNNDGSMDIADVTAIIEFILKDHVDNFDVSNADVNGDGDVGIDDVTILIDRLLNGF